MNDLSSIDGVCDLSVHAPKGTSRGWLLVEIPHGATRKADYERVESKLKSALPKELIHFFFVNTDIGAPEGAQYLARTLPSDGIGVVVARCLMPRTFIDTNRVIAKTTKGVVENGLTPGLPGYIDDARDAEWLTAQHAAYHELVGRAYAHVCGQRGGYALQLHSFAPKSVSIEKTDAGIIEALHAAYVPETYAKWPERPAVDLIAATQDGSFRCSPKLVADTKAAYAEIGVKAEENATYHLHPSTMGLVYAQQYPEKVLCVELNRGLVADPFTPFGESPISPSKVERMTAPIAKVLRAAMS
jgi:hypothetical protein